MDIRSRRMCWLLAGVGALHGWFRGCCVMAERVAWFRGLGLPARSESLPWILALVFGAALFLGGWLYLRRPPHERGSLLAASACIVACTLAFACGPAALVLIMGHPPTALRLALESIAETLAIVVPAMPSAMLLVYLATQGPSPRPGSLLAGADRGLCALAAIAATSFLPWWRAPRGVEMAPLLVLAALPALAISLHALVLLRRACAIGATFAQAAPSPPEQPVFSCDLGVGFGERCLTTSTLPSYRNDARSRFAICQGSPETAEREARRLAVLSALVFAAASIHAISLHAMRAALAH